MLSVRVRALERTAAWTKVGKVPRLGCELDNGIHGHSACVLAVPLQAWPGNFRIFV
jgi:hypothetical protein